MLDPFPIAPPTALVHAIKPLADALNLHTLPLHAHEVIVAAVFYTVIEKVFSPWISNLITPQIYSRLSRKARLNWDVHVVSMVQSLIINGLSLWILFADEERAAWRYGLGGGKGSEGWEGRIWGYYGTGGLCQSFALGYFLWDLYSCMMNIDIFGWGLLAHAVSAVCVFGLGYRPLFYFHAPIFLLYELSSPFLNIHWFCDKLDLTGSIYQAINGVFLVTTFFFCRLVWGSYNSVLVFRDMWWAIQSGHTNYAEQVGVGGIYRPTTHELLNIAQDPVGQLKAFNREMYTPLWIPAIYLASNTVLNVLNVLWFGKMIETIRTRFPPPWGTKGVAQEHSKARDEKAGVKGRPRRRSIAQLNPEGGTYEEELEVITEAAGEAADGVNDAKDSTSIADADIPERVSSKQGSVRAARAKAEEAMNGPIGTVEDTRTGRQQPAEDGDINFGMASDVSGSARKTGARRRRKA